MGFHTVLCELTAVVTTFLLNGLGVKVVRDGAYIGQMNGELGYQVIDECDGMKSVMVLALTSFFYGMYRLRNVRKTFFLTISSAPIALGCNILRCMGVIYAGYWWGQEASSSFHVYSGYITFYLAVSVMFLWCEVLKKIKWKRQIK